MCSNCTLTALREFHAAVSTTRDKKEHEQHYQQITMDDEIDLFNALQLPRMARNEPLTLRLLVVGDMDLNSASELAEYALNAPELRGGTVDIVCAVGPFSQLEDLFPYLRRDPQPQTVISKEHAAAMEGLVTGCLSQLESIVCRLVWIPSQRSDPLTLVGSKEYRLTPNSRNLHRRWIPLAPGLGCGGLAENEETSIKERHQTVTNLLNLSKAATELPHGIRFEHTQGIILSTSSKILDDDGPQDERVLLRIHNGSARYFEDFTLSTGSLRENGEFTIVTIGVVDTEDANNKNGKTLRWEIIGADFFHLPR